MVLMRPDYILPKSPFGFLMPPCKKSQVNLFLGDTFLANRTFHKVPVNLSFMIFFIAKGSIV
jgi:hypothetical protein